jgi:hypothetical protein
MADVVKKAVKVAKLPSHISPHYRTLAEASHALHKGARLDWFKLSWSIPA